MRCTSPKTVGFLSDGKTLCWSPKKYSKEFAPFQLPCGKCISCRLEIARQKAVRCIHEASQYENNSFLTLTYSDENLKNLKLDRRDIDLFIKKLRDKIHRDLLERLFPNENQKTQRRLFSSLPKDSRKKWSDSCKLRVFGVGEYGTRTHRKHWHLLAFNWRPSDAELVSVSPRGDRIYRSRTLEELWPFGFAEFGDVTFESAGYCARYSLKKLSHGRDGDHGFEPIPIYSNGIGKGFLEKYFVDTFNHGFVVLPNGSTCGIPRYYERWLLKNHPEVWENYIKTIKTKIIEEASEKEKNISNKEKLINLRRGSLRGLQIKRTEVQKKIMLHKFKQQQENQKF